MENNIDSIKTIGKFIGAGLGIILIAIFDKLFFLGFMYITKPLSTGISNIISWF